MQAQKVSQVPQEETKDTTIQIQQHVRDMAPANDLQTTREPDILGSEASTGYLGQYIIIFGYLLLPFLFPFRVVVVQQYERALRFRLGRMVQIVPPGVYYAVPLVDTFRKVDLRVRTVEVPRQSVITRDGVSCNVDAVIYYSVVNAAAAICNVASYANSTFLLGQTTLRSVLGQVDLDTLLAKRDQIGEEMRKVLDKETESWGIRVSNVEIRDVVLPTDMIRFMASQAEAERERRAKIISADGEFQSSQKLAEAAAVMQREPMTLQLRYLQTLAQISAENNSTIVFPLPIDIFRALARSAESPPVGNNIP
jgi:regulator of protease activity HflC (stomatin/prohibitin superfamily)